MRIQEQVYRDVNARKCTTRQGGLVLDATLPQFLHHAGEVHSMLEWSEKLQGRGLAVLQLQVAQAHLRAC